jgi:ankyrin repeat protein
MSSDSYVESLAVLDTLINDVELGKAQLLDGRGNVNWVDQRFGNSMLHVLAFRDLCDQLKLLISFGADINVRNKVRTHFVRT